MTIRIGLLGASKIAGRAVIAPARRLDGVEVTCVAARDPARAASFAAMHAIPAVAAGYAELVQHDAVDLVYNALPPGGHMHWTVEALSAGKHVLCEKPFAMNAVQAQQMVTAADRSGRCLIEAFHYRFHPLFRRVLAIVADGGIGTVEALNAHVNVPIPYTDGELRYDPALGGGALMDLGCYAVHWVRSVMGNEPRVISAGAEWHASGVDLATSATLEFPGGVRAAISCRMSPEMPDRVDAVLNLRGSEGSLAVVNPLVPQAGHTLTVTGRHGTRQEQVDGETTFDHQLRHVLAVIAGDEPPMTGGDDAVNSMRVIDRILALCRANGRPGV